MERIYIENEACLIIELFEDLLRSHHINLRDPQIEEHGCDKDEEYTPIYKSAYDDLVLDVGDIVYRMAEKIKNNVNNIEIIESGFEDI